jgi:PiT family inorganic phosphate transporter
MFSTVVALVFVALIFDYINGFHDAANSIATVVSTRPCRRARRSSGRRSSISSRRSPSGPRSRRQSLRDDRHQIVTFAVVFGGLSGAIIWDLITWFSACRPVRRTR